MRNDTPEIIEPGFSWKGRKTTVTLDWEKLSNVDTRFGGVTEIVNLVVESAFLYEDRIEIKEVRLDGI
jgi:hypothetical protein